MNVPQQHPDDLIRTFATRWQQVGDPQVSDRLLADPILVLGPNGTTPIPRAHFVHAVAARADAAASAAVDTTLDTVTWSALGDRMVVATITWGLAAAGHHTVLVSDFLLQREPDQTLRCVAYLPRTNILDHLPATDQA